MMIRFALWLVVMLVTQVSMAADNLHVVPHAVAQPTLQTLPQPLEKGLQRLAALKGFSCAFKQTISYDDGSQQQFSGTLAVAKLGRFRWQYTQPYQQLYVSNGKDIWFYEPDLMQVQHLQSLDAIDPIAMRLLEGRLKPHEIKLLGESDKSGKVIYHLRLGAQTELWLSLHDDGLPAWFESRDVLGNRNRMQLLSLQTDAPNMKKFEFKVPKGVDVLNTDGQMMER